jgi:hypothetical protein
MDCQYCPCRPRLVQVFDFARVAFAAIQRAGPWRKTTFKSPDREAKSTPGSGPMSSRERKPWASFGPRLRSRAVPNPTAPGGFDVVQFRCTLGQAVKCALGAAPKVPSTGTLVGVSATRRPSILRAQRFSGLPRATNRCYNFRVKLRVVLCSCSGIWREECGVESRSPSQLFPKHL